MQLGTVVDTWSTVRATRSRRAKREALADLLRTAGEPLPILAAWLSGSLPQGRIGVGPSLLRTVNGQLSAASECSTLTVEGVDATLTHIQGETGPGSSARRSQALRTLLQSATERERVFLLQILAGELRQGATEGVFLEAVALAAGVHVHTVQRAFMLAGDLSAVTITALRRGAEGLTEYRIQVFRPLRPMLAASAETPPRRWF